ncbi:Spo0E like sporulation regulatory protein [Alicyclobacillus sacchari]|uniref:Spo0E like sporulation regulatory protein n=1 Tax=Alicyclobacillus sacchari TaxID=392010 RepID=A0A4R8LRG7_9BACL|nr:aspartyl-phosphate phosphatase Spo0E family protein [Alicyclobacillus sacchari]TDY47974.1 Spo0E like sporulation regulatory protein [Alicyclobacillus sacchari]
MACAGNTTDLVEYLRKKMIETAEETGNLLDERVIRISQLLDLHLVAAMRNSQQPGGAASDDGFVPRVSGEHTYIEKRTHPLKYRKRFHVVQFTSRTTMS